MDVQTKICEIGSLVDEDKNIVIVHFLCMD